MLVAMEIALLAGLAGLIPSLIAIISKYVAGQRAERGRSVRLEINGDTLEISSSVTDEEQARLIERFLERQSGQTRGLEE
jgi:hypothetical protein